MNIFIKEKENMDRIRLSQSGEMIIYPSRVKLMKSFVLSILFILVGAWLIVGGFNINIGIVRPSSRLYNTTFTGVVGITCCVFFGMCSLYIIKRMIIKQPSIIVNENGITDNASAAAVGLIKWSEVKEISIYEYMGQKLLGIVPKDVDTILCRIPAYKRVLLKINKRFGAKMINIPQNTIDISLEKISESMLKYMNING